MLVQAAGLPPDVLLELIRQYDTGEGDGGEGGGASEAGGGGGKRGGMRGQSRQAWEESRTEQQCTHQLRQLRLRCHAERVQRRKICGNVGRVVFLLDGNTLGLGLGTQSPIARGVGICNGGQ